jgi:hypothetical protein
MVTCVCGSKYEDHRTGLSFAEVRRMMFVSSDDPKQWRSKRRHSVLGFWRELKLQSWKYEHGYCVMEELANDQMGITYTAPRYREDFNSGTGARWNALF